MKTGDKCPSCTEARLTTVSSRAAGVVQVRYLRCPRCGHSERSVVDASMIRRRSE